LQNRTVVLLAIAAIAGVLLWPGEDEETESGKLLYPAGEPGQETTAHAPAVPYQLAPYRQADPKRWDPGYGAAGRGAGYAPREFADRLAHPYLDGYSRPEPYARYDGREPYGSYSPPVPERQRAWQAPSARVDPGYGGGWQDPYVSTVPRRGSRWQDPYQSGDGYQFRPKQPEELGLFSSPPSYGPNVQSPFEDSYGYGAAPGYRFRPSEDEPIETKRYSGGYPNAQGVPPSSSSWRSETPPPGYRQSPGVPSWDPSPYGGYGYYSEGFGPYGRGIAPDLYSGP
jgi:hypothetical protein